MKIILASGSLRRKTLLNELGFDFKVVPSNANEDSIVEENPRELVRKLSMLKAAKVARGLKDYAIVIGSDTIVVVDNEMLGKPKSRKQAREMLSKLSGNEHFVFTGICLINTKTGNVYTDTERTKVRFRQLSPRDIKLYSNHESVLDWAGAYAIQHQFTLIQSIDGSLTNVIGFPTEKLIPLLRENGIDI